MCQGEVAGQDSCKRAFGHIDQDAAPETPARKILRRFDSCGSEIKTPFRPCKGTACVVGESLMNLDKAAAMAMQAFDEMSALYLRKYHSCNDEAARKLAESLVPSKYDELVAAITSLIPCIDGTKSRCDLPEKHHSSLGSHYEVLEFQGRPIPRHLARKCDEVWEKLDIARKSSNDALARDTLCAAMAAISSRESQVWLDACDMEFEWKKKEKGQARSRRRELFEEVLRESLAQGARGFFAKSLVDLATTYRVAVACKDGAQVPASLLLTYSLSMCKALEHMDSCGPLRGKPADWRRYSQFALQELLPEEPEEEGTRYERVGSRGLRADPAIRNMIRSGAHVLMLEAFAALAPRKEAQDRGLSTIVRAELDKLLRDAKERGQGVVFMLGGDDPAALARKVYLKPPFTNYGLRIGHLRWRESADAPWAREKPDDIRILIGLQLP